MKTIYTIVIATVLFISCGEKKESTIDEIIATNDVSEIKAKKVEIERVQQGFSEKLKKLNEKIDALDTNKKVPLITTFKAKEEVFTHFLELQGNVETKQNILVYPEMPGILVAVFVKEGQAVKKGEVLAKIKDGGMSQQLSQLETQAELARTTF